MKENDYCENMREMQAEILCLIHGLGFSSANNQGPGITHMLEACKEWGKFDMFLAKFTRRGLRGDIKMH